tara:strand:- start:429 stop:1577 length:1149 start_codon:yes stop_codon:yes gene_type:complete
MSKIKVNRLENTSTANGGIDIDTSGHVQVDGLQMPTAGPLSNRNMLINGSMVIDQRNSGTVADTTGASYLSCDRWSYVYAAASKFTAQQTTTTPVGFYKSLQLTSSAATSPTSTNAYIVKQIIEGNNIGHLNFGGANAKTITLSFNVKASVTGDYSVAITNGANSRSYVTTFNVTSTGWEYKTITISGDTTGSWANDNTAGLAVKFDLGSGTDFETATTDAWQSGDFLRTSSSVKFIGTNAATFNITGVQLEVGSKATPFEHENYGQTLAKCQRYYLRVTAHTTNGRMATAGNGSVSGCFPTLFLPTTMRAQPSVAVSSFGHFTTEGIAGGGTQVCTGVGFNAASSNAITLNVSASGGNSSATGGQLLANTTAAFLELIAEL